MDPGGPWSAYASYNRLAGVQAGATGDFHHHLTSGSTGLPGHSPTTGVPSTTSQLLLQAAHTTASLAGQLGTSTASPFNPGGFLSPAPVAYDAVFSPLFHHANPKPAHYSSTINAQHRQVLAQAQAAAASKQASGVDSDLSTLRENYTSHHQTLAAAQSSTFFDQPSAPAGAASGLTWQGNNQLPSPFGILPHESVVPSSPSPATSKASSTVVYENFNAHFAAAQTLNNHLNSQLTPSGTNKAPRSASPQTTPSVKPVVSQASGNPQTFFQTPAFGSTPENISTFSSANPKGGQIVPQQDYASTGKQRANASGTATGQASSQQPAPLPASVAQDGALKVADKKVAVPVTGPGSGFMASYLKFLQGERDTSPPPTSRGGRKATWSRNNSTNSKTYNAQNDQNKPSEVPSAQVLQNSNGAMLPGGAIAALPLPSPGGMNTSVTMSSSGTLTTPGTLSVPGVINSSSIMSSAGSVTTSPQTGVKSVDPAEDGRYFPQSKDKKRKFDGADESFDSVEEEARRLNKPVLNVPSTPLNDKGKKGRAAMNKPPPLATPPQPAIPKKARVHQASAPPVQAQPQHQYYYQQPEEVAAHGAGIDYADYSEEDTQTSKKLLQRTIVQPSPVSQTVNSRPLEDMPYQNGEFVAIKSELSETWPAIWRVDGKSLLQRFEPFDQNGKVMYRNISTYAAWNPENKKSYVQVPVRVRTQTHLETIVELVRSDLPMDDNEFVEKRVQETLVYQDNFEVYIQTLISHALDPNFLTEIFQEQDEYFLSNVKTVDEVTEERRRRILNTGGAWPRGMDVALATWPCLSVGAEVASGGTCRSCGRPSVARASLYGQPYNPATLEARAPDPRVPYEKEFLLCRGCCLRAQLYIRVAHQKYLMFIECSKRVTDKRVAAPHKDTTVVLNELLADEVWLSQLFRDIRQTWSEAELMERKARQAIPPRQMV